MNEDKNFRKEIVKELAVFAIVILAAFLLSVIGTVVFRKLFSNNEEILGITESSTIDYDSKADTKTLPEDMEDTKEKSLDATVTKDNYIEVIKAVILGSYEGLPVTDKLIENYENDAFRSSDIESIEEIPEMCEFSSKSAAFNITVSGKTLCYGVRFALTYGGEMNFCEVYSIPGADVEIAE